MTFLVIGLGVLVVVPVVAILTEHQRKMAEIHARAAGVVAGRMAALESRIEALTGLVHEQTIALDTLVGRARPEAGRIEQRRGG